MRLPPGLAVAVWGALCALLAGAAPQPAPVQTFTGALGLAYLSNPRLLAARQQLRQVDENVPQAIAGWRPRITIDNSIGGGLFDDNTDPRHDPERRLPQDNNIHLQQNVYTSGEIAARVARAEAEVAGQRAELSSTEADVLLAAGTAYVDVVRDRAVASLNASQLSVLQRRARASAQEVAAGAVTPADAAQSEARAADQAAQSAQAESQMHASEALFLREIGTPAKMLEPLSAGDFPIPASAEAAVIRALSDNPEVVATRWAVDASRRGIDVELATLLPHLFVTGKLQRVRETDIQLRGQRTNLAEGTLTLSVPLYQGGLEYSRVRAAKELTYRYQQLLDDARQQARQQATTAWDALAAARTRREAQRRAITANEIALRGIARQQAAGARTVIEVLNAQQEVLSSQVALTGAEHDALVATLRLLSATGQLNAADLHLDVPGYDPGRHYQAVRDKWIGTDTPR